jgi:SpoU rRNA methylase family enzyme
VWGPLMHRPGRNKFVSERMDLDDAIECLTPQTVYSLPHKISYSPCCHQ